MDNEHDSRSSFTDTLNGLKQYRRDGVDELMIQVEPELRRLAMRIMNAESASHTLQATALVNEAYLKLVDQSRVNWQGRTHFFAIGARMMRRILVDHARRNQREKRGGQWRRLELTPEIGFSNRREEDILIVEEVLCKLDQLDSRQAEIVELKFFGGLTVQEIAELLDVSKRTVESDWTLAKAWLQRELAESPPDTN